MKVTVLTTQTQILRLIKSHHMNKHAHTQYMREREILAFKSKEQAILQALHDYMVDT